MRAKGEGVALISSKGILAQWIAARQEIWTWERCWFEASASWRFADVRPSTNKLSLESKNVLKASGCNKNL
jgi:hypothetical protein